VTVLLLSATGGPARPEVVHGSATVWFYAFNFSGQAIDFDTQTLVSYWADDGDLGVYVSEDQCIADYGLLNGARAKSIPGIALEALTVAPPLPYGASVQLVLDRTHVVLTNGGVYAKFAFRTIEVGCPRVFRADAVIEYYVQTDGSPNFGPTVPVESTTWGRLKALYR
jgi:hypothetical protein